MKKAIAVFLAVLMAFSFVSVTAFAKVENSDKVVDELVNGEYSHVNYVVGKKYFKTDIATYTALGLYDKAWDNYFTGSVDTDYAKTILLALIDRFEEEYNNETYEEIIKVLKTASSVAELVEKVDSYTGILDLAENSAWATSLGVVNAAVKAMNMSNDLYEQYVQGYAVILSCQAASVYYGDFLDYIAANVSDKAVKAAANELKANITQSLEEARDELIKSLAEAAGKQGASIGINLAMSAYSVTAVISSVYNAIGSFGDKLFATKDKYQYMSSLAMITKIEEVMPTYVNDALASEDEIAGEFAVCAILTMRETGESMLARLGKVTEDSIVEKLIDKADMKEMINNAAMEAAKLNVYSKLLKAEETYKVVDVYTSIGNNKKVTLKDSEGIILATISAGKDYDAIDKDGCYVNVYNDAAASYVQVIVTFVEDTAVTYTTVTTGSSTSSSSTPKKSGLAGIFQSIIDAFMNAFKSLFSFGKK